MAELEIVGGQPARQASLRVCRLKIVRRSTDEDCGKYGGATGTRVGAVPGMVRPAAVERVPRRMCFLCGLGN